MQGGESQESGETGAFLDDPGKLVEGDGTKTAALGCQSAGMH